MILAKRPNDNNNIQYGETLLGHSECVVKSFNALFGKIGNETRLKKEWFKFFKLDDILSNSFYITGVAACYLHDIGKANNYFQQKLIRNDSVTPPIRHEHLSGLILWNKQIKESLEKQKNLDYTILLSSVIGHHLRAKHEDFGALLNYDIRDIKLIIKPIKELITKVVNAEFNFNLSSEWRYNDTTGWEGVNEIKRYAYNCRDNLRENNLLWAVRTALILADSAGSALVREGNSIIDWINQAFDDNAIQTENDIQNNVISPRIRQIEARGINFQYSDFQNAAESMCERSLLIAPCGSGKTIAAWRWIKGQMRKKPAARVIFLYPTRATATEGFKDYISWAPEADAALMHGTAQYELEGMFDDVDERANRDYTVDDRLFALGYWNKRIFSATVDQFLSFMQHSYRSICLLPLLTDSVIVIDEIHSFDKTLFSMLKKFLKEFNIPVLCMTASLPKQRQNDLLECGLSIYPENMPRDLIEKTAYKRYQVKVLKSKCEAFKIVNASLKKKKKILWVVNTIKRCQEFEEKFRDAIFYHSRFKLNDRKTRHDEVIKAFLRENEGPIIAITTQVCEMSLDLDADVLITEKAPITSLIQRMGRCNRHAMPESKKKGFVYIYDVADSKPYNKEDLSGVDDFIKCLNGKNISQLTLQELLEKYGPKEIEVDKYAAFFEDCFWAKSRDEGIRDEEEFTVQAVLDNEIEQYLNAPKEEKPGYLLPIPRNCARQQDNRLERWLFVADSTRYNNRIGFKI